MRLPSSSVPRLRRAALAAGCLAAACVLPACERRVARDSVRARSERAPPAAAASSGTEVSGTGTVRRRAGGGDVHDVLLWTWGDDVPRPALEEGLAALGANGLSLGNGVSRARFAAQGVETYLDEAAGKGTLHLRERQWRPAWDRFFAAVADPWPGEAVRSRPACLRGPDVVASMLRGVTDAAESAAGRGSGPPAFAISLSDEPSMTVRANPGDWCLCHDCVLEFRRRTRERFDGDLRALNTRWGTEHGRWEDVVPWTTAAMRARCLSRDPDEWNLAPWVATRAFQDATFAETTALLSRTAQAVAPDVPTGLTGTQAPSAFGGWDYRRLAAACDFLEPYDIGLALPIARDLGGPRMLLAQTLFPSDDGDGRTSLYRFWRGVARGAQATIVWSSKDALRFPEGHDGVSLTEFGSRVAPTLREVSSDGSAAGRLARAAPLDGRVRIVVSQPSIAVRWMLDSVVDKDTWPRRFGSWEATHSTAIASRERAWRALADRSPRFVDARDLTEEGALDEVDLVVLPDVLCLSEPQLSALTRFAASGGRVVADVVPGEYDESGRANTGAARRAGLPLVVDEDFERLPELAEESLGAPPLTVRMLAEEGADDAAPSPIEVAHFVDGDRRLVLLVPLHDLTVTPDGSGAGTLPEHGTRVRVAFPDGRPRAVRDERTGKDLGTKAELDLHLPAEGGVILGWDDG